MTQEELAAQLHVTRQAVSAWETGKALPDVEMLERIAADTPDCTESSLKTHVSHLRTKLRAAADRDYLEAVWGIGFRLRV